MIGFVLDASVTLCWLLDDQATAYTDGVLDRLADGEEALVPAIWSLEVANTLVVSERRKVTTPAHTAAFLEELGQLPVRIERGSIERAFKEVLDVARRYRLSAYDGSYLDLAMKTALPLATVDTALGSAARAAGVGVV